jgi:uncharacterized protein (TIGR00369 family)
MSKDNGWSAQNMFLVRSEHLNHNGHLFGGDLMSEIDTTAYCCLRREFGEKSMVTRAAEIEFMRPAHLGDAMVFKARVSRVGTTSVQVEVVGTVNDAVICSACMTYVNMDRDGRKAPL